MAMVSWRGLTSETLKEHICASRRLLRTVETSGRPKRRIAYVKPERGPQNSIVLI